MLTQSTAVQNRWAMPATLLASTRCEERRQNLLSLGAQLANTRDAVGALHRYLCATVDFEGRTLPRATAATRLGWHGNYFVLPDRALGGPDEVVYQSTSQIRPVIRSRRTLEEWQARVEKLAAGNTRLELALSAAEAALLLGALQMEGTVVHFCGGSSIGKTSCSNGPASRPTTVKGRPKALKNFTSASGWLFSLPRRLR